MSSSLVPIQAKADESPRSNLAKPSAARGAGAVVSAVVSASSPSPPAAARPVAVDSSAASAAANAKKASFDFITSSNAVKDIFMLPYAINRPVSVAIHNVEGTLILEDANDHPAGARFNRQAVVAPIRNTNQLEHRHYRMKRTRQTTMRMTHRETMAHSYESRLHGLSWTMLVLLIRPKP
jgi:hypothetical protein